MKNIFLIILVLVSTSSISFAQSKTYIPTKFDSVKKVVPNQVYGRPKKNKPTENNVPVIESKSQKQIEEEQLLIQQKINEQKARLEAQQILEKERLEREALLKQNPKNNKLPKNTPSNIEVITTPIPTKGKPKESNSSSPNYGYGSKWTLQKCVEYARDNNLQITANELNARLAKLTLDQSRNSRIPSLNGTANLAETYGRSIDPTSNQFVTKGFLYNTLGLQSQALLFGWFQKKYQIEKNQLDMEATNEVYNQLKDDISLNVATGFLRILLAREQVKVSQGQLRLDMEQLNQTVKFVNAGKLPELNLAQMTAQLANDSALIVANKSDERIALLQLRALMNFNFEQDFDIDAPSSETSGLYSLANLPSPQDIFITSIENQHQMKVNQLKLLSAQKSLDIAKSVQYPQLSAFGNLGTNFSTNVIDITGQTYQGEVPVGNVNVAGTSYPITTPSYKYTTATRPIGKQYGNNIQANAGLGLSVPIFNGYTARTNIERAKIGLVSQQIAMDNDQQKLKQDIYTAYEQAKAASQKYSATKNSQDAAQRALDFAVKRYAIGMLNTYEYTSILNSLYAVSSNVLSAKYDLLFKLKVLDYYMGNPLKM